MERLFKSKKILVTGGAGSIGHAIVHELLRYNPETVRILDIDETREFEMARELAGFSNVRFLLGNLRDKERLLRAVEDIDIIFHAGSLKHVLACEYNPFEAVKTNVLGTQNLIDAALEENVGKVVFTSSDKAVNPCNVMGATKLVAESLITAANYYRGARKSVFCSVRFGNVLGSRGSIIPSLECQIRTGGSATLTDEKMTRFIMSPSQAIDILFRAVENAQGGEIFIPKMKSVKILDMFHVIIEELSHRFGFDVNAIKVEVVGRKLGEKLFEEIMTQSEAERSLETEHMFIVLPEIAEYLGIDTFAYPKSKRTQLRSVRSDETISLSKEEIRDVLIKENLLAK